MRSAFALQALGDFSHIISKRCLLTSLAGECGGGGLESCSVFVCVWVDVLCVCVWQRRRERECVRLCYALQFPWPLCEILLTRRLWAWHTVLRQCRGWEEQSKWWRGSFSPVWQGKQVLEEEPIEDRDGQESAAATHLHRCNAMDAVRWMFCRNKPPWSQCFVPAQSVLLFALAVPVITFTSLQHIRGLFVLRWRVTYSHIPKPPGVREGPWSSL